MGTDTSDAHELSVTEARNHFSDRVNRAVYGGEVTFVTRGRRHQRAAAIVPADMVEHYEELLDERDAPIAAERLADIDAGRSTTVPFDEVMRRIGLSADELGQ
ncbi:type II toxin-antitoxin system prevent-host-death family antitoxin [Nocardiopsis sp. NPDC007018]|uniref:type II toxin-antitoxin system prevent-host-death family antitoxin n=1 Tax=Nocardiopsis sp. NPDC007018 TaxID=3155721 RepID=UPI0033EEA0D2